jgi:hypothetical protein
MELSNTKDEQEKHQSQKCFFNIEVERIHHVSPKSKMHEAIKEVSVSEKYLCILEESTRDFLGIKYCYKYYNEYFKPYILSNKDVNTKAKEFLEYYEKPTFIQMDINDKKNLFFSRYYGIKLSKLFNILKEKNYKIWEQQGNDEVLNKKFRELLILGNPKNNFNKFLVEEYERKNIYASTRNGYDLGDNAFIGFGIVDEFDNFSDSVRFFHIYEIRLSDFLDQSTESNIKYFHSNLIEYIQKTFVLNQTPLTKEHFSPVVFDLKNIHRKSKLLNEPRLLDEAITLNEKLEKYMANKSSFTYLDIINFFIEFSIDKKESTEKLKFKKAIGAITSNKQSENLLERILRIILKDEKLRKGYEEELKEEHKERITILKKTTN